MKIKKIFRNAVLGLLMMGMLPAYATAPENPVAPAAITKSIDKEKMEQLEARLNEIKAMDIENMSRSERHALRKEVKEIQRTMDGGGLYISVGALIIIIILLIILL